MDPLRAALQAQEEPQSRADASDGSQPHEDIAAGTAGMSTNKEVAGDACSHVVQAADKVVEHGSANSSSFMASAADLPQVHPIAPSGTDLARDTDATKTATSTPSTTGPGARSLAHGEGTLVCPPRLQGDGEEWGRLPPHEWHLAAMLCAWHRCECVFLKHPTSIAAGLVALGVFVGFALAFSSGVDPVFATGPLSGWAALAVAGAVALAAWFFLRGSPPCGKASSLFLPRSDSDRHQRQQQQQQQQRRRRRRRQPHRMRGWWDETSLLRGMCFVLVVTSAYGFQPADRTSLKHAVNAWCSNSDAATTTYGDINTWDVRTRKCTHCSWCPPHSRP